MYGNLSLINKMNLPTLPVTFDAFDDNHLLKIDTPLPVASGSICETENYH